MRPGLLLLGIGLGVLWAAGLRADAARWLVWLDLVAAVASLVVAAVPPRAADRSPRLSPNATRGERTGEMGSHVDMLLGDGDPPELVLASPFLLAGMLLLMWLFGLALHAERWLAWVNFGFGLAYGLLGVGVGTHLERTRRMHPPHTA